MKNKYKVLITTSGLGERLGEITKYTNKALITLGDKPVLSHAIDLYPQNAEFFITLGHFGKYVQDFLELAYPERNITLIDIPKYRGEGSSLAYSMLQAKKYLQCPFIFHASDTIVTSRPPNAKKNWVYGYKSNNSSQYRSFNVIDGYVQQIKDKGELSSDYLHIGLVGIYDYSLFWDTLTHIYKAHMYDSALSDADVINEMIAKNIQFTFKETSTWYDTGNTQSLQKARSVFPIKYTRLEKPQESISFVNGSVIKFFYDKKIVADRIERAKVLKGIVPKIKQSKDNFYSYSVVKGEVYADKANPSNFLDFLSWSKKKLWKKTNEVTRQQFTDICFNFYHDKSIQRINTFLTKYPQIDKDQTINNVNVPSIFKLIKNIDFDMLSKSDQTTFHGDFILDNVIFQGKSFRLVDWRENFGGLVKSGDMYYDLAKLNHNLILNHSIIAQNLFTINISSSEVVCDILRKENLVLCQNLYFEFLKKNKINVDKVKILTGLIWLNMSPLHHHPFDLFLFHFGKLYLWRALNEK